MFLALHKSFWNTCILLLGRHSIRSYRINHFIEYVVPHFWDFRSENQVCQWQRECFFFLLLLNMQNCLQSQKFAAPSYTEHLNCHSKQTAQIYITRHYKIIIIRSLFAMSAAREWVYTLTRSSVWTRKKNTASKSFYLDVDISVCLFKKKQMKLSEHQEKQIKREKHSGKYTVNGKFAVSIKKANRFGKSNIIVYKQAKQAKKK